MLTQTQRDFVNKHLVKFAVTEKGKKKNTEAEQKYEDYLIARTKLELRVRELDDTDTKKKKFEDGISANEKMVKDRKTLDKAILGLVDLNQALDHHFENLKYIERSKTTGGRILNEILAAARLVQSEMEQDEVQFGLVQKKIEGKNDKLSGQVMPTLTGFRVERDNMVRALYGVPHGDTDDIEAAKVEIAKLLEGWEKTRKDYAQRREKLLKDDRALTSETMAMEAVQAFRTALGSAETIIGDLETWGAAKDFHKQAGELRAADKSGADYTDLLSRATDLLNRVTEAKQERISDYAQASNALRNRMELLRKGMLEIPKGTAEKEQIAQLDNVIKQCELMLASGANTQALTPIRGLLDEGDQLLADLRRAKTINLEIKEGLKEIEGLLKNHLKNAIRQTEFTQFSQERTTLDKEYMNQPLSEARSSVIDLHSRVTGMISEENAQKLWREGALAKIKQQRKEFEQLSELLKPLLKQEGKKVEPYAGHLVAELDLAEEWATTKTQRSYEAIVDGKLLAIHSECVQLIARLEGRSVEFTTDQNTGDVVNTDTGASKMRAGKELLEDHGKGIEAKSNEAADRKLFVKECTDFLQMMKDVAKTNASVQSYADEVKVIRKRVEEARGTVRKKKEGDASGERRMLQSSQTQFLNLMSRKPKLDTASLGKIGENWRQAVSVFDTKIGDLVRLAKEAAGSNSDAVSAVGKLEIQLGKIRDRFNPGDFDGPASILGNEETAQSLRLRVREDVLSRVRANRELIEKDPLIRICVANPFKVDRFVDGMRIKLKEIELEVLRGA